MEGAKGGKKQGAATVALDREHRSCNSESGEHAAGCNGSASESPALLEESAVNDKK